VQPAEARLVRAKWFAALEEAQAKALGKEAVTA
jgi:hypothetical protein